MLPALTIAPSQNKLYFKITHSFSFRMPGSRITPQELIALQESIDRKEAPREVLKVLSGAEYRAYREGESIADVILPLRRRIFHGEALPDDFLTRTRTIAGPRITDGLILYSDQIAVLCEHMNGITEIKTWVLKTLARYLKTSDEDIQRQVTFEPNRMWYDGPVTVSLVVDRRNIAGQLS